MHFSSLKEIKILSKAYTEGIYADTPANRKLGRVGMTYQAYAEKIKKDKEEKAEKKEYTFQTKDEEFSVCGPCSKEKILEEASNYVEDMVIHNNYESFKIDVQEDTSDWTSEDFEDDKKQYEWYIVRAEKHNDKVEISIYDMNKNEYIRNDAYKREQKNLKAKIKRDEDKRNREFEERFGWMDMFLDKS